MSTAEAIGRYHSRWHRWARLVAQRGVLAPVVRAITRTTVQGTNNLEGLSGPFVLVANHASHLDATLLVTSLPYRVTRDLAVGAAADYFYRTWWRRAATALFFNSYPVARAGSAKGKGMSQRLVSAGVPVLIFPEGTRSRDGAMRPFKPGAAVLCVTKGVPCVPVALIGTGEAMPVGRSWPVPGRPPVTMLVGRPMRARPGESARELNERITARISTMLSMQTPYVLGDGHRGTHTDPDAQEEAS